MIKRIIIGIIAFAMAITGLLFPLAASAADAPASKPLNLITSPLPINLSTTPGTTVTTDLRVKQASGSDERLKVSLMKFGAYGDEGKPQLADRGPGDDYFDWARFDKTQFNAPNNEWQTVKMTINVPKSAAFGYYYAVVFSRVGDDVRQTGSVNSINGGTAVLVLLDAKVPGAKRSMELASFSTDHRLYEFVPSMFNIKFKNTGNVHMVPTGNVFISKGDKQVATLNVNEEQGNILPNSNRIYQTEWRDGFPHYEPVVNDGKVKVDAKGKQVNKLVWNNGINVKDLAPHLRFGKYTAHLFAIYDDGQRDVPIESEISFWVVPWRALLVLLIVIILVGLGVFFAIRGTFRGARRMGGTGKKPAPVASGRRRLR